MIIIIIINSIISCIRIVIIIIIIIIIDSITSMLIIVLLQSMGAYDVLEGPARRGFCGVCTYMTVYDRICTRIER